MRCGFAAEADFASGRARPHTDSCTWSCVMVLRAEPQMLTGKSPEHRFLQLRVRTHQLLARRIFLRSVNVLVSRSDVIEFCMRESWILSFENLLAVFTMCIILRQRAYYLSKRSLWTLTPCYCPILLIRAFLDLRCASLPLRGTRVPI